MRISCEYAPCAVPLHYFLYAKYLWCQTTWCQQVWYCGCSIMCGSCERGNTSLRSLECSGMIKMCAGNGYLLPINLGYWMQIANMYVPFLPILPIYALLLIYIISLLCITEIPICVWGWLLCWLVFLTWGKLSSLECERYYCYVDDFCDMAGTSGIAWRIWEFKLQWESIKRSRIVIVVRM